MPPFAPYFGNIHHGQIQHFQQATSTSRNATFIYGAGKKMTARSRQSEKCRREAIWLAEKPYRRSYPMVSTPEFDPDSGQTKMGQIWVNSQKKAKTTPELQGSRVVLSCQFFRKKQYFLHNRYHRIKGVCWQHPTKMQEKTPGNKTWGLWLRGQDLNLRSRLPPRSGLDAAHRAAGPFGL